MTYQHQTTGERRFRTKERVRPQDFSAIENDIDIVIGINDFIGQPTGENPPPNEGNPPTNAPIFGEALATESAFAVLTNS